MNQSLSISSLRVNCKSSSDSYRIVKLSIIVFLCVFASLRATSQVIVNGKKIHELPAKDTIKPLNLFMQGDYITGTLYKTPLSILISTIVDSAAFDSTSLSTRIDLKLNKSDTASLSSRINVKMGYADTAGLSSRINYKLNASDTTNLYNRGVLSFTKNASHDSTILTLNSGLRFAVRDSFGSGGGGSQTLDQTLGFGNTTDTTVIFDPNPNQINYEFIKVNPIDTFSSQIPFRMTRWSYQQNSGAVAGNEGLMFGFNINSGGGIIEPGKPGLGFSMESNYLPDYVTRYVEWHDIYIPSVTAGGLTAGNPVRLNSYTLNTATNVIDLYRTVSREYLYLPGTSVQYWLVQPGSFNLTESTGASTTGINSEYQVDHGGLKNLTRIYGQNMNLLVIQGYANIDFSAGNIQNIGNILTNGYVVASSAGFTNSAGAQLSTGYDGSNYMYVTTGSTGNTTFDITGTNPKFIFSDPVELSSTLKLLNHNTTANNAEFGTFGIQSYGVNNGWLSDNLYYNGTDFKYRANGYAILSYFGAGGGDWFLRTAPSGSAGATATMTTRLKVANAGAIQFGSYGSGSITGTAAYNLSVDASGNIIESALGEGGGGGITGAIAANQVAFGTGTDVIAGSNNFTWDTTNLKLGTAKGLIVGGSAVIGLSSLQNPALDIVVGHGDGSSDEYGGLRIRGTNSYGNVIRFGVNATGIGGSNQGYGYIQHAYWGGDYTNVLALQPKGGQVSIGPLASIGGYYLQTPSLSIKASDNTAAGALGGSISFPLAASYVEPMASISMIKDQDYFYLGAGLVFYTAGLGDGSTSVAGGGYNVERMRIASYGNVSIGGAAPEMTALLDIQSTTKGFLPPRMTKTQRDAISSPATGLVVYQTDNTPGLRCFNGSSWMRYTETAD